MHTTDTIKCPGCGKEIPQDAENCPNCGAPISVLMHNDISGAPIDNSAAIDAMLRSASQFMEESESLGLNELDIFNDEDEQDKKEETVFKKVTLKELPPELADDADNSGAGAVQVPNYTPSPTKPNNVPPSDLPDFSAARAASGKSSDNFVELQPQEYSKQAAQAQQSARSAAPQPAAPPVQSGYAPEAVPNIDTGEETETKKANSKSKKKGKKTKSVEPTLYEVDEKGNPVKQKGKKAKATKKDKKDKAAEKAPKQKARGASGLAVVIAVFVSLAIGGAGGFFAKTYLLPEMPVPECQEFASRAVEAVNQVVQGNRSLYVAEAYVNDGTYSAQCVFRAMIENTDSGEIDSSWFRVKVDHNDEGTTYMFFELDDEEYERLRNSDNSDDRANAANLRSYQNELDRCIKEITEGSNNWISANTALLNNDLHPYKSDSAAASAQG